MDKYGRKQKTTRSVTGKTYVCVLTVNVDVKNLTKKSYKTVLVVG